MKRVLALAAALSLLGASGQDASAEDIRVMTQNQFLGADLGPILLAVGGPPPCYYRCSRRPWAR